MKSQAERLRSSSVPRSPSSSLASTLMLSVVVPLLLFAPMPVAADLCTAQQAGTVCAGAIQENVVTGRNVTSVVEDCCSLCATSDRCNAFVLVNSTTCFTYSATTWSTASSGGHQLGFPLLMMSMARPNISLVDSCPVTAPPTPMPTQPTPISANILVPAIVTPVVIVVVVLCCVGAVFSLRHGNLKYKNTAICTRCQGTMWHTCTKCSGSSRNAPLAPVESCELCCHRIHGSGRPGQLKCTSTWHRAYGSSPPTATAN
jgi:hypothetical protein